MINNFYFQLIFLLSSYSSINCMELVGKRTGLSKEQLMYESSICLDKQPICPYIMYRLLKNSDFAKAEYLTHESVIKKNYNISCMSFQTKPLVIYNVNSGSFLEPDGNFIPLVNTHGRRFSYAFDAEQKKVAIFVEGNCLLIFDVFTKKLLHRISKCDFSDQEIALSNATQLVVTCYQDKSNYNNKSLYVWHIATESLIAVIKCNQMPFIKDVEFSLSDTELIIDCCNVLNREKYTVINISPIIDCLQYFNNLTNKQSLLLRAIQQKMVQSGNNREKRIKLSDRSIHIYKSFSVQVKKIIKYWVKLPQKQEESQSISSDSSSETLSDSE